MSQVSAPSVVCCGNTHTQSEKPSPLVIWRIPPSHPSCIAVVRPKDDKLDGTIARDCIGPVPCFSFGVLVGVRADIVSAFPFSREPFNRPQRPSTVRLKYAGPSSHTPNWHAQRMKSNTPTQPARAHRVTPCVATSPVLSLSPLHPNVMTPSKKHSGLHTRRSTHSHTATQPPPIATKSSKHQQQKEKPGWTCNLVPSPRAVPGLAPHLPPRVCPSQTVC